MPSIFLGLVILNIERSKYCKFEQYENILEKSIIVDTSIFGNLIVISW